MGSRYLGYVTDQHLTLYEVRDLEWERVREFTHSQADELANYLHRDKPLHLLADLVEMEFRFEQVTFLRGADRRSLHQRKLTQAFRASPYRHAFPLGRIPGKRGDEKLLLSAITNPELIEPWIAPLRQRRLPISGIASVPVLQNLLATALTAENPHLLLVTAQCGGRIRITYFFQREMRFSRLAAHPESPGNLEHTAFEEIVRTHQYLLGLRLMDRTSPVDVVCLLPEQLIDSWQAAQPSAGILNFRHIDLGEIAQQVSPKTSLGAHSTEDLFIALLLKSGLPNHFAPVQELHYQRLFWIRRSLLGMTGLVVAIATAATAGLLFLTMGKHQEARQTESAISTIEMSTEQVRQSFPKTPAPTAEVHEALALTRNIAQENAPTRQLLADISRGFDAVPQAELDRLAWVRTDRPEHISGDDSVIDDKPPAPTPEDGLPRRPRWVAIVSGHIVDTASYQQANAATDALRDAIRKNNLQVEVLLYPFNIRPDSELKEDFSKPAASRQPFLLRVLWNE